MTLRELIERLQRLEETLNAQGIDTKKCLVLLTGWRRVKTVEFLPELGGVNITSEDVI